LKPPPKEPKQANRVAFSEYDVIRESSTKMERINKKEIDMDLMRIIHKDLKNGVVKLRLENLDDLWHLNNVIEQKDLVFGVTYRRDEKAADKIRAEKVEKKRMWLGVEVEK
jgi:hypothetical protein